MNRELPESLSALLGHVQEKALSAQSEKIAGRLVQLLRSVSPRISAVNSSEADAAEGTLQAEAIDVDVVKSLCCDGIPDEVPALRAVFWKVVLGYLPTNVFEWDTVLKSSRETYREFIQELLSHLPEDASQGETQDVSSNVTDILETRVPPPSAAEGECEDKPAVAAAVAEPDAPKRGCDLADLEDMLEQINKDIYRTRAELTFFARRLDGCDVEEDKERTTDFRGGEGRCAEAVDIHKPQRHYDALARVLLLFGRLNPGIQYVQGMNELSAPLYYLFASDPLQTEHAEADTFFCFSLLMADMRDAFVKSLDHTENGMIGRIGLFSRIFQVIDPQLWNHLDKQSVSPLFYSVRWLTLMLTQELEMPEVLRVWDALLSDVPRPYPLLFYICVAMVMRIRENLLMADFNDCMALLQHYPPCSVDELLQAAVDLRALDPAPFVASAEEERGLAAAVVSDAEKAAITQADSAQAAARERRAAAAKRGSGKDGPRAWVANGQQAWANRRQAWGRAFGGGALEGSSTSSGGDGYNYPADRERAPGPAGAGRQAPAWVRGIGRWLDEAIPERPP